MNNYTMDWIKKKSIIFVKVNYKINLPRIHSLTYAYKNVGEKYYFLN